MKHNAFIVNAQSKALPLKGELYISRRHFEVKPSFLQVLLKITTLYKFVFWERCLSVFRFFSHFVDEDPKAQRVVWFGL